MKNQTPRQQAKNDPEASNLQKDPSTWTTGDEPMTAAQKSYLTTLSEEAGEQVDESLTKAEASMKIDELRQDNPRVADSESGSKA